uniref:Uncharacterized protein n=1 Tax=Setaria italica TaxID=4555 RepID=K3YP04_SETIT
MCPILFTVLVSNVASATGNERCFVLVHIPKVVPTPVSIFVFCMPS